MIASFFLYQQFINSYDWNGINVYGMKEKRDQSEPLYNIQTSIPNPLLGFWQTEYDLSGTGCCRVPKHKIEPYILYIPSFLKKWYTLEWIIKLGRTFILLFLCYLGRKRVWYINALCLKKTLYDISFVLGFSVASCKQTFVLFPLPADLLYGINSEALILYFVLKVYLN